MSKIKISKPERLPREGVTDTDLNTWINEIFNYLNQEDDFHLFKKGGPYESWQAAEVNPDRIAALAQQDVEANNLNKRRRQLHNYLTIIAGCAFKDQYMVIINQSTSFEWIWNELKTVYQITSRGKDFLSIVDIKWDPTTTSAISVYNSYRAKILENLKPSGTHIKWKQQTLTADESLTPTFEDHILLTVLQIIDTRLPAKVREVYGPRMEDSKLLMDFKMDILTNVPKLIQDIDINESQVNAMSMEHVTPTGYIQSKPNRGRPWNKQNQRRPQQPNRKNNKFCRLCHLARRPFNVVATHEIGDLSCPSLSSRDRESIKMKTSPLNAMQPQSEDEEDQLEALARSHGYDVADPDTQVDTLDSFLFLPISNPKHEQSEKSEQCEKDHEIELENRANYIQPIPSQILTVYDRMNVIHLDLDSGCWVSCAKLDFVKKMQWNILPNGQLTKLADNKTVLKSVGEIHQVFTRNNWSVTYKAIVLPDLHTPLIAGNNFISDNKLTQNFHKQSITIHDKYTVPETNRLIPLPTHLNSVTAAVTSKLLLPNQTAEIKTTLPENTTVLVEPRMENNSDWPLPQLQTVQNGKITIENQSSQPVKLKTSHKVNLRRVEEHQPVANQQCHKFPELSVKLIKEEQACTINTHAMSREENLTLQGIMEDNQEVFDQNLKNGYNQAAGKHICSLNWASSQRPSATKVKIPVYNTQLNVLLQEVCDSLTEQGVLGIPQEEDIQVQAVSPCFLRKKQSAKNKPNSELTAKDVRLVVNTNQVGTHLKNMPTKITKQSDVFLQIAKWKHIIKTDLHQGFFQNHLSKSAQPWCAIQTPFGGLRHFKRSIQGLLGQSEELDELLSKVLKKELTEGKVIKIADDLFVGGTSVTEALSNWSTVLQALGRCNIKLSPKKTVIFPKSVDILSWVWNEGGILTPSAHRKQALEQVDYTQINLVKDLRSWVGLYKTFLDCTPDLANLMDPFDQVTASKDSADPVTWTPTLIQAFVKAKQQIGSMVNLYLPSPEDQLIITTDAARSPPGLGTVLKAKDRTGVLRTVRHYSVKLKSHMQKWQPCEIEAAAIGTAIEAFKDFIRETLQPVLICSDSKPVVDAAHKILQGKFSLSPKIQTFLNNLSKINCEIRHIAGKTGHNAASDYTSRNTYECAAEICQICNFVEQTANSVLDPKVASIIQDMPSLLNRNAWKAIQDQDKSCKQAITCLTTGQTPTKKKGNQNSETRRISKVAKIAQDGLLIVENTLPMSTKKHQRIVVPGKHLQTILMQIHLKHGHPTKNQMILIFNKNFYSYGSTAQIDALYESCSMCTALKRIPKQLFNYEVTTNANKPGTHFGIDIMKRNKQHVLVARDQFSSYTTADLVNNETAEALREGIIRLIMPFKSPGMTTVRTDNAKGFQSLANNDPHLKALDIKIELSDPNNKNGNACIDKGIQELQHEILRIIPHDGLINITNLAKATSMLNSRIRRNGTYTADEIMFSRNREAGTNLTLNDQKIANNQLEVREKNNKKFQSQKQSQTLQEGDIVHKKQHHDKNKIRDSFLVTSTNGKELKAQKILYPFDHNKQTKIRAKTYVLRNDRVFQNTAYKTIPKKRIAAKTAPEWSPIKEASDSDSDENFSDDDSKADIQHSTSTMNLSANHQHNDNLSSDSYQSIDNSADHEDNTQKDTENDKKSRQCIKEKWITRDPVKDFRENIAAKKIQRWMRSFLSCRPKQMKLRPRKQISYKETLRQEKPIPALCPSDLSMQDRLSDKSSSVESLTWDAHTEDLLNEAFLDEPVPTYKLALNEPIQPGRVYEIPDLPYMALDSPPHKDCPTQSTPRKKREKSKDRLKKFLFK